MDQTVGFIGLGTMGKPMALNLHKAGYKLNVYNRSLEKTQPFKELDIPVSKTPAEVADHSDIIIIMVSDSEALIDVVLGYNGVQQKLSAGKTVINMSTVSHKATLEVDEAVRMQGARFIEAPVSGTKKPAEDATLTILAGGDEELVEEQKRLLKTMGKTVIYCGDIGQATYMKLTINLLLGNMMQALGETLVFGKKLGLKPSTILENIGSGPLNTPLFSMKGNMITGRNFEKSFPVNLLLKDLDLVLDAAKKNGVMLPQTSAAREAVNGTNALGYGEEDMAAVVKLLEKVAGVTAED